MGELSKRAARRAFGFAGAALTWTGCASAPAPAVEPAAPAPAAPVAEAAPAPAPDYHAAAVAAYIAGYPAVEIARTRMAMTNVAAATAERAPVNQFAHLTELVSAAKREVVTPNNDTPYSIAFLNLSAEPLVLHLPNFGERYYTVPFLSAYHEHFATIGQRTEAAEGELLITAPDGGDFLITGPGFTGQVPAGMKQVPSPTNDVWIIMRPLVSGPRDLPKLVALKKQIRLVPLSAWGNAGYVPPPAATNDTRPPELTKLGRPLYGLAFFELLGEVLQRNPLPESATALREQLAQVGITSTHGFDPSGLGAQAEARLEAASQAAVQQIQAKAASLGSLKRGWRIFGGAQGLYHGDYLARAAFAYVGLGVINPQEAVYPLARTDGSGSPLDGKNDYILHFEAGNSPPAAAFWSLSMYGKDMFFVDNPIDRYSLGNRSKLRQAKDGSLTLYLQHEAPKKAAQRDNWLPAPEGEFYVVLRMYLPSVEAQRGEWVPPAIQPAP